MKTTINIIFTALLICYSATLEAYIQNRTDNDAVVHWSNNLSTIDVYLNPANTQGYSTSLIQSEVASAVAQWNGKSRLTLRQFASSTTNQSNVNEIYFTTDSTIFGSGVVGITQVFYKNNTGEILEADILINDTETYSSNMLDQDYLGNVITHEMGHLLGLGHSQVIGSTMFYALTRGQNKIDED
ncbi:MAG: matrixin family metalloprotease, partial [Bdellovibrionales bacterium]|nr:matrixin family metalloprotease [Bdellovibrionales bacterium]